jgi:hypothetical protein
MYQKTANLLTGETDATLEEQAKMAEGIKQVQIRCRNFMKHFGRNLGQKLCVDKK